MLRTVRSTAVLLAGIAALQASPASAQTTVFSTFGQPGYTFNPVAQTVYSFSGIGNWLASSFVYSGPTATLGAIDFAAVDQYQGLNSSLDITFLTGNDMNTATALESWSILPNNLGAQVYTETSVTPVTLTGGNTYWVELSVTGYAWGWNYNDQNALGNTSSFNGVNWVDNPLNTAPAFDVVTAGGGSPLAVVPEPATMSLMASGLVGLMTVGRRRKRSR